MNMKRLIAAATVLLTSWNLWAQAPEMFRYQGRLLDGTNLVNAALPMNFKLYDALSGGNKLYEDSASVTVVDGLYSTYIGDNTVYGSLTNAMTNVAVYLELTVNNETLSPRERLVSVPYALNANTHTPQRIISLSDTLAFGNCLTGSTRTLTMTVYNDGDSVMTVTGIHHSDACFSGNCSGKVHPYSSTNITVTFAPTAAQTYNETLTVNCDKTSGINSIICTGTGIAVRYVYNGDGTVTDTMTGLMWLQNAGIGGMTRDEALIYCNNLVTNGYSDWRLPSVARDGGIAELDTLFREYGDPSSTWEGFEETPFTGVEWVGYWSGTPYAGNTNGAWYVNMSGGGDVCGYSDAQGYPFQFYVWPVRGGQ